MSSRPQTFVKDVIFKGNVNFTDATVTGIFPVPDTEPIVHDPVDDTRKVRVDAGAVATATTRTIFMPDADVSLAKDNLAAAVAPVVTDDANSGYTVGSKWIDTTADVTYICVDSSIGAAVWNLVASLPVLDTTPLVKDPGDNTKLARIDVGNVATATTRVLTMPDADVALFKDNLSASVAPVVGNDNTQGYAVGSRWIDTTADIAYVCVDASTGVAVWSNISTGGSSLPVDDSTSLVQDPIDNTKQTRIDTGAVATATTRTLFMPDSDISLILDKRDATIAPAVGNDNTQGYAVGSVWIDVTGDDSYTCVDASTGAAVWVQTNGGGSSLPVVDETSIVYKTGDATANMRIDADNIATATTRVLTMPDADKYLFQDNNAASTTPGASNDNTEGYAIGSSWLDTTANLGYICLDASTGAAVWKETTTTAGTPTLPVDDTTALVNDPIDDTKRVRIDAGAITTATTRALFMPDSDITLILDKRDATVAPGASNDNTEGYAVGSVWIDTTADNSYVCADTSTGAAVWLQTNGGGGGSTGMYQSTELGTFLAASPGDKPDFTSIAAGYDKLTIEYFAVVDDGGTGTAFRIIVNADTTVTNYHSQRSMANNGANLSQEADDNTIALCSGDGAANIAGTGIIEIIDYDNVTTMKQFVNAQRDQRSTSDTTVGDYSCIWETDNAAVTRIQFDDAGANGFNTGSWFKLYGWKKTT